MKKYLNTLYVMTGGAYLFKEGESAVVTVDNNVKLRIPIHTIGAIVCFGHVACSPGLMGFCGGKDVHISFLSEYGRFLARVVGPTTGNVLLRREQYRRADDLGFCAELARAFIAGKIANCRTVLNRALRDHGEKPGIGNVQEVSARLKANLEMLKEGISLDEARGVEGDSANLYYSVFDCLITAQKEVFYFHDRNRRPPKDNMNALLSFLYTLLMLDMESALESVGLDPAVGFLHRDRPGRPSLALDMMEEFRPILADRLALSLVNLQEVQSKGFEKTETGAVVMDEETRKKVLVAYQNRKKEEIVHPFLSERVQIGLLPHLQALLMARFLRGDVDGYPPFVWR
jgi:CRISPR-associated protein Cas1